MVRKTIDGTADFKKVASALKRCYGDFAHHNKKNPLAELLFILCSVRTRDDLYLRTYATLRKDFPTFASLAEADEDAIARALNLGGLQNSRARTIKKIISILQQKFGRPTLAPLRHLDDEACEAFLCSLPGVGKKVARCVMLYSFVRQVFPVDTHCWRICRRLGWVEEPAKPQPTEKDMDALQALLPPKLRFSLHVNMVSLGREICTAKSPRCGECPLLHRCSSRCIDRIVL